MLYEVITINGYGRIGRMVLRALYEGGRRDELEIVAINDLGDAKTNAHLTRYDTAHGPFPFPVTVGDNELVIDGKDLDRLINTRTHIPGRPRGSN